MVTRRSVAFRKQIADGLPLVCLGLTFGILLGRYLTETMNLWLLLSLAASLAACMLCRGRKQLIAAMLCAAALGGWLGAAAFHPFRPLTDSAEVCGWVCDEVEQDEKTLHTKTRLCGVTIDGVPLRGDAYWTFYGPLPEGMQPGCRVLVTASVYAPSAAQNEGGFDFEAYLLSRGMTVGIYGDTGLTLLPDAFHLRAAAAALRHTLAERLRRAMGDEAGGFASAMLLGTRSWLSAEDRAAFNRTGAAHLLSVSGFHVSILAAVLMLGFKRARFGIRLSILALVLAGYALLTGMNTPVLRASLLFLVGMLRAEKGRASHPVWSLCAIYVLLLLGNPAQLVTPGFHMTFGAVAGILLCAGTISRLPGVRRLPKGLRQAVGASAGAQLGLLMPMLLWYQSLPVISLLLNLVLLPLASLLIVGSWIVLLLTFCMPLAEAVGLVVSAGFALLKALVAWTDALPVNSLWTGAGQMVTVAGWILLLIGIGFYPKRRLCGRGRRRMGALAAAGALFTVLSVLPLPHTETEYIQLSVGNADAAILWDGSMVTVIDTGSDNTLAEYLHAHRLGIDRLILTHLHDDHAGGLQALLEANIPIGELVLPEGAEYYVAEELPLASLEMLQAMGTPVVHVSRGDTLATASGSLTVLWPEQRSALSAMDANDRSLCLVADIRGTTMLLTGDLSGLYEDYCAVPSDILKAAHHGSNASSGEAFLNAVDPQLILLSCGDSLREQSMLERAPDTRQLCTRSGGMLTIRLKENGYEATTWIRQSPNEHEP